MLFVIIGYDGPNGAALRPSVRPAHLENLQPLVNAGRVVVGGPFTDGSGSLMVVDFEDERGRCNLQTAVRCKVVMTDGIYLLL